MNTGDKIVIPQFFSKAHVEEMIERELDEEEWAQLKEKVTTAEGLHEYINEGFAEWLDYHYA